MDNKGAASPPITNKKRQAIRGQPAVIQFKEVVCGQKRLLASPFNPPSTVPCFRS